MEHDLDQNIFDAIDKGDWDGAVQIIKANANILTTEKDEKTVIAYAFEKAEEANNDDVESRRQGLKKLLQTSAATRREGLLPNDADLGLTPLLLKTIYFGEKELTLLLIEAGADPNALNPSSRETALFVAVSQGNLEIVKLLLAYGADPELVCTGEENALQIAIGKKPEIFWYMLFHQVLGPDVPADLVTAFAAGGQYGEGEQNAIAAIEISKENIVRLWAIMLRYSCPVPAAATVSSYCQKTGIEPDRNEGRAFLGLLLTQVIPDGNDASQAPIKDIVMALKMLAIRGFRFRMLPPDTADQLLLAAISQNDEASAYDLLTIGVRPSETYANNQGQDFHCAVLDVAIERRMAEFLNYFMHMRLIDSDGSTAILRQLIEAGDAEMLAAACKDEMLDGEAQVELLLLACQRRARTCLAVLLRTCCAPEYDFDLHGQLTEQTYTNYLLFHALALAEGEDPDVPDRYDCARMLLLLLVPTGNVLKRLCDFIILDCAQTGDFHAIYFLCRFGFSPFLLMDRCLAAWAANDIHADDKARLAKAVEHACCGLSAFIETMLNWNLKRFAGQAADTLLPGTKDLTRSELIHTLLTVDMQLVNLVYDLGEHDDPQFPEETRKAAQELATWITCLLKRNTELPTLTDLAAEAIVNDYYPDNYGAAQEYLLQITSEIARDVMTSAPEGAPPTVQQLLILQDLAETPDLRPYFFSDEDSDDSTDSSSASGSHDEESSSSGSHYDYIETSSED